MNPLVKTQSCGAKQQVVVVLSDIRASELVRPSCNKVSEVGMRLPSESGQDKSLHSLHSLSMNLRVSTVIA